MSGFSSIFEGNVVGLGTFPFASPFGKTVSSATARVVLNEYLDDGGVYIDTAPTYADGEVETLMGDVLSHHSRDQFFVNTSCGWVRQDDGRYVLSGAAQDVRADLDGSLQRLRLQFVDSYISHMPDPTTPFVETMRALQDLKDSGRVRHIGVSNVSLEQLKEYDRYSQVEVIQNRFSLINRSFDTEFLDYCKNRRIALVAYQVIERGLLTDRTDESLVPNEQDLRSRKPEFESTARAIIRSWVANELRPIAKRVGISTEALAIAWASQQVGIAAVQCGASNQSHLEAIRVARTTTLGEATVRAIEGAYSQLEARVREKGYDSVRRMMGLEGVDPMKNISVSGRLP